MSCPWIDVWKPALCSRIACRPVLLSPRGAKSVMRDTSLLCGVVTRHATHTHTHTRTTSAHLPVRTVVLQALGRVDALGLVSGTALSGLCHPEPLRHALRLHHQEVSGVLDHHVLIQHTAPSEPPQPMRSSVRERGAPLCAARPKQTGCKPHPGINPAFDRGVVSLLSNRRPQPRGRE